MSGKKFLVKNGLTTQNISFTDNIASGTSTILASILSNNTLSFSGNSGQLFSITDSMSGTIFAVNDISGVPSIEVDDSGAIRFAETFGNVVVGGSSDFGNKLRVFGNTRIDGNVFISNSISSVNSIQFNLSTAENTLPGQLAWNAEESSLDLGLTGNVTMQIGQEQFYYIKNQTGNTIPNGSVVRAAGTVGLSGRILGALAVANGSIPSKYIIGVATEDIADGADGFVSAFGKIRGLDTTAFSEGDILYADPVVPGGLSNTAPRAPNNIVTVAFVVTKDANQGELFVRPTYGSSILEDESVFVNNPQTGDSIFWVASNSRFEARQGASVEGYQANDYNTYTTLRSEYQANDHATWTGLNSFIGLKANTANPTFTGNVTIPEYVVHSADSDTYLGFSGLDTVSIFTGGQNRLHVVANGFIGIGSTSPVSQLAVTGTVTATDFNSLSDQRLKQNTVAIANAVYKVQQINGYSFEWKDSGQVSAGVLAQEIEQVLPELVSSGDIKTVNYNGLIALLVQAVKELSDKVDALSNSRKTL